MKNIVQQSLWIVLFSIRHFPFTSLLLWGATIASALIPTLQVILVGGLTDALYAGQRDNLVVGTFLIGLVVAGNMGLEQVTESLKSVLRIKLESQGIERIARRLSKLKPEVVAESKFQQDARAAQDIVENGKIPGQINSVINISFACIMIVSLCIAVGSTNIVAAILLVLSLLPMSLESIFYSKRDEESWDKIYSLNHRFLYNINQISYPGTAQELALLKARQFFGARAAEGRRAISYEQISLIRYTLKVRTLAGILCAFLLVGSIYVLMSSGATAGAVSGALVGALTAIAASADIGAGMESLTSGAHAIRRYRKFFRETPQDTFPQVSDAPLHEVSLDSVSITYPGSQSPAVHHASLGAERGKIVALVGANGAGKTTIIHALLGALPAGEGRVLYNGADLQHLSLDRVLSKVAVMTQDFGRYEITIRENITLGTARTFSDAELWQALAAAELEEFVRSLPDGLDTQLGEQWDGVGLSGGQWQRLALARLILRNADVWILDEPTSAVDAQTEEEIFATLRKLAAHHTTILSSHRGWTLKYADYIYVLQEGRIVEEGSYRELSQDGTRFSQIFASQTI